MGNTSETWTLLKEDKYRLTSFWIGDLEENDGEF